MTWNGTAWTIQNTPVPAQDSQPGYYPQLVGVSCVSAAACTVLGGDGTESFADVWNGATWSLQTVDDLANPERGREACGRRLPDGDLLRGDRYRHRRERSIAGGDRPDPERDHVERE